jgi:hypothetical protein
MKGFFARVACWAIFCPFVLLTGCGGSSDESDAVTSPNVVGLSEADADAAISAANLTVGNTTSQSSETVASGLVLSETPVSGTAVEPGSLVSLTLSTGPAPKAGTTVIGVTTNSNPSSAELLTATLDDESTLTYIGAKTPSGNPATLSSIIDRTADSTATPQLEFDASGELTWAGGGKSGYSFQFIWKDGTPTSVTITAPDGTQIVSAYSAQAASAVKAPLRFSRNRSPRMHSTAKRRPPVSIKPLRSIKETSFCEIGQTVVETACTVSKNLIEDPEAACGPLAGLGPTGPAIADACIEVLTVGKTACDAVEATGGRFCDLVDAIEETITEPTANMYVNPQNVVPGQSVLLSWRSTFATSCTPSGGTGSDGWTSVTGLNGDLSLTVPASTVPGTYNYSMSCSIDNRFAPFASVSVNVSQYTSTTSVSVTPAVLAVSGGEIKLFATITSNAPLGAPAPTGIVAFVDQMGNTLCGAIALTQSTALCDATVTLAPDTITVRYSGDALYGASSATASIQLDSGNSGLQGWVGTWIGGKTYACTDGSGTETQFNFTIKLVNGGLLGTDSHGITSTISVSGNIGTETYQGETSELVLNGDTITVTDDCATETWTRQ